MSWSSSIFDWFVPIQNQLIYLINGQTVFERIIGNRTLPYPQRVHQIEKSLQFNSSKSIDEQIERANAEKKKSLIHNQIYAVLHKFQLYQNLIRQIDAIRQTKVTGEHYELFERLWSRLVRQSENDHEEMTMISKRWTKIGFQGSNPLTDFRGMGLLGLQSIEYLSRDRTTCLSYVNIPSPNDYSFAIGVINAVSWLVHLLEIDSTHPLLSHFAVYPCNIEEFFRLFALVFHEWHLFWTEQQATIMQFEELSKIFRAQLLCECQANHPIRSGFRHRIVF